MEQIKVDNFMKENPECGFPKYTSLDNKVCTEIRMILFDKLSVDLNANSLTLVEKVDKLSQLYSGIGCDESHYDLKKILLSFDINPDEYVYINWYRYDEVDRMRFVDLAKYIHDIWYPDVDDIDIFDASFTWVLSLNHSGQIKILML
ncbi:MAG: hypothetical protein KZQ99_19405 [Candidatus Thiodiazotropha sp. (ex Dulcina madagascariensis)]|nr:hypothetical protein [Candidatus Thiodiazotropha sp. (ex Dulcina madagascariensis)]